MGQLLPLIATGRRSVRRGFGDISEDYSEDGESLFGTDEEDLAEDYATDDYPSPVDPLYEEGFISVPVYDLGDREIDENGNEIILSGDELGASLLAPPSPYPIPSESWIGDTLPQLGTSNEVSSGGDASYFKDLGRARGYTDAHAGKPSNGAAMDVPAQFGPWYAQGYAEGFALGTQEKAAGAPAKKVGPIGPVVPKKDPNVAEGMSTGVKVALGLAGAGALVGIGFLAFGKKKRGAPRSNPSRRRRRRRSAR